MTSGLPAEPPETPEEPPHEGRLRLLGPGPLVTAGLIGLIAGWSVRTVWIRADRPVPEVSWLAVGVIWFFAVLIAAVAYLTRRTLRQERGALSPDHAVNRLVLGKASALMGAALGGGYIGFAIAHVGIASASATGQIVRSGFAAVGGLAILVAGLALEHACRVRDVDE